MNNEELQTEIMMNIISTFNLILEIYHYTSYLIGWLVFNNIILIIK